MRLIKKDPEKAFKELMEEIPKLYDYNLYMLINAAQDELKRRNSLRATMVNSIADMCDKLLEWGEEECTFYYRKETPELLTDETDNEDKITDKGYESICQVMEGKVVKRFKHLDRIFRVKAYIGIGDEESSFDVEIIDGIEEV